jgi:hypothetical protein
MRNRRPFQNGGPDQSGIARFHVPDSLGNEFIYVTATIPQIVPCGGVVCCDFDDDILGVAFFIGGRWNNHPNELKLRLYMQGPNAAGDYQAHYAIFLHQGPPNG